MNLMKFPVMLATLVFGISSAFAMGESYIAKQQAQESGRQQQKIEKEEQEKQARAKEKHQFAAQVVGMQWLNPLEWKDYPVEWNLLWTLGIAKPNKDDEQVKDTPARFSKVQKVSGFGDGSNRVPVDAIFETHVRKTVDTLRTYYFTKDTYFYTVASKNPRAWREMAGIRIHLALPERINMKEAVAYLREDIVKGFSINRPDGKMSTSRTPPDVHAIAGGASAGFTSLSDAMDYLEANPDKTVWVMSFDSPSYPKKVSQINESSTLLILAHPSYKTEREPLAWLHRPSSARAQDFTVEPGLSSRTIQAWQAALIDAAARGGTTPMQVRYFIHDAGMGDEASSRRIGIIGQALTETVPEFDFHKHTFNTPGLLGDMGAGTALTNIALAIAYAHHMNMPVMVAGTHGQDSAQAMLVRPPANPRPFDPEKNWFRARGGGTAYLPWWGIRHDRTGQWMQGWSD